MYFCTLCPSIGPKERSRQALDRLPRVSNFLTNFWVEHFDGARLSPNSFRNTVWHALNEPVCQYLRTRNPLCSAVYIFTHAAFDSQLPRCRNAQHRQMKVIGSVQITGRSMLFSTVAGMCILYTFFIGPLAQSNNSETLYAKRFKPSTSTLWEKYSRIWRTHSSVLGCERRPVSASIMSRSCFASFPVCVYKFSSHYLNNMIFIDDSLGRLAKDSPCIRRMEVQFILKLSTRCDEWSAARHQFFQWRDPQLPFDWETGWRG